MIGGFSWPQWSGRQSPLWRDEGRDDRTVLHRTAAAGLLAAVLVPAVLSPSAHGFWRDLIWYVVWVVAPAWLVVAFLAALVSVGAWGPRVNVVLAGVVVLAPVLVCLALGGDWILVGPMVGAAALATGFTAARRWRSSPARVPASR